MSKLLDVLSRAHHSKWGLINFIAKVPLQQTEPNIHIYVADFQDPLALSSYGDPENRASGNHPHD